MSKQDVCLLAETTSMKDASLKAGTLHAVNPETCEAWGMDSVQMAKDEKTGRYVQFIGSANCDPIPIYKHLPVRKTDIGVTAAQTEDQELNYINEGNSQRDMSFFWFVGVALTILTFLGTAVYYARR